MLNIEALLEKKKKKSITLRSFYFRSDVQNASAKKSGGILAKYLTL